MTSLVISNRSADNSGSLGRSRRVIVTKPSGSFLVVLDEASSSTVRQVAAKGG